MWLGEGRVLDVAGERDAGERRENNASGVKTDDRTAKKGRGEKK